ncbi:zona pellucida sperm-binding protein 3-like isoform X2 [Rhineura floridana]|uniref:zona pellucida sperm-binding protein 3-like isoform X2 n=1 Tax=Rhineura floridana TaxID=261503 RepID=UPI002AC8192E|nr:zona pellucida sperm-binding protein 3-like isoform X2 [Rhineura floridana]
MKQKLEKWFMLFWGLLLLQGCFAQFWSPTWEWPETRSHVNLPAVQPAAPFLMPDPPRYHAVKVECEEHRVVVTVHRDLFGVGKLVAPSDLTLGESPCPPVSFDAMADVVVFEAGLHECGSIVEMTPDLLIYQTRLFYKPSPAANPVITRTNAAEIPIECHYPRKSNVSSKALQPTWAPFRSTVSAEARLGFVLRLMNDDWSAERLSTSFQLGDVLHLQAEVSMEHHLPLRLFVDSCVASPEATSESQYAIVDSSGCLIDGRQDDISSTFLSPRLSQEILRFTVDAFRFAGDSRNLIYIMCRLKVTPADQVPNVLNKACSFNAASSTWLPVEGPQDICSCCETRNCDRMLGEEPQRFSPRHRPLEMSWQRNLPDLAAPQAHVLLGPFFVFDSPEGFGEFPGDPAAVEEMAMAEFMPVMEFKEDATGAPLLFQGQEGVANFSREQEDGLGLPMEVYMRGGPIFINGAEDGSGFEDLANGAKPEGRAALELKAEVITMPLKDTISGAEKLATSRAGKLTAMSTASTVKGPEQQSSMVLLLYLLMAGVAGAFLILGGVVLVKRCCHHNSASLPSPLGM